MYLKVSLNKNELNKSFKTIFLKILSTFHNKLIKVVKKPSQKFVKKFKVTLKKYVR